MLIKVTYFSELFVILLVSKAFVTPLLKDLYKGLLILDSIPWLLPSCLSILYLKPGSHLNSQFTLAVLKCSLASSPYALCHRNVNNLEPQKLIS